MSTPEQLPEDVEEAITCVWNEVFDFALDKFKLSDPDLYDAMLDDRSPAVARLRTQILAALTAARAEATETERERCAKICDYWEREHDEVYVTHPARDAAAQIRQGEPQGSQEK